MASEEDISQNFEELEINVERNGTDVYLGDKYLGAGRLQITENEVLWSGEGTSESLCLSYPDISLHAVSRDVSTFPHPCLYMLCADPERANISEEESDNDESPTQVEIRLVLENSDDLDAVFDVISECQSYHPDPELSTDSEGDQEAGGDNPLIINNIEEINEGSGYFRTVEDLQYLSTEGQRTLEHLERLLATSAVPSAENGDQLQDDDVEGQFEDADG